jgi:endonuclease/exonuclease/phosphatase family metal-dependent hydrolase
MTTSTSLLPELKIAAANFHSGGIDHATGSTVRWEKTISALRAWQPHIVLCQEISAVTPADLRAHLWATANALGMIPLLGPPTPLSVTGNHPAILIRGSAGLTVLDSGPPDYPPGTGTQPAWCEALVKAPGWPYPLHVYSVHFPARSSTEQRSQADRLACRIAQLGELAVAEGGWNCYGRADEMSPATLDFSPLHLRPPRVQYLPQDQTLMANYDVHDVLAAVGMVDAVAFLRPEQRQPAELTVTGINGRGRVDRFYLTFDLTEAAVRYVQQDTGGSDHQALMLTLDTALAAEIIPWGPRP